MLTAGTKLGPYEIVSALGAGGMGEVYRARDTRLQRDVAIKVLPSSVASDADRLVRFEHEARTASSLNHPNILTIFEVGDAGGVRFIVSELVIGETLRTRLSRSSMPVDEALRVAAQIATGLSTAHDAGIVHRDLKPENVMIRLDGLVKLLDFGLAKLTRPAEAAATMAVGRTEAGMISGTTKYMSPEQARGLAIDARSDIFSFGVVVYEMLTGRPPFDGPTSTDVMVAILERQPPPIADRRHEVFPELQRIVSRCLEKDRERRYRSAQEMLADLKRLLTASSSGQPAATSAPSIAVLPFTNLSADKENEYFSDGLADEILSALTRVDGLRVIARTSSFAFRDQKDAIRAIGERLNVGAVLEGTVRRAGQRVRVTVQLVNVADESPIWSDRFDREMTDVFALQDEIAAAIVGALKVKLTGGDHARLVKRYTENVDAYNLLMKGRFHYSKLTPEDFGLARQYLEQAIAADPNYPLPYIELAHAHFGDGMFGLVAPHQGMARVRQCAQRAIELDDTLAESHAWLGLVKGLYDYDWPDALAEFRRAVDRNPASALTYHLQGLVLAAMGRTTDALIAAERSLEVDPFSPLVQMNVACWKNLLGEHEAAIAHARLALEVDPHHAMATANVGAAYSALGRHEEAIRLLEQAVPHSAVWAAGWLGAAYVRAGRRGDAERLVAAFEDRKRAGQYVAPFAAAVTCAALGDVTSALDWYEAGCDARDPNLCVLVDAPAFAVLRDEPRYRAVRRKMRLDT